MNSFLTKISEFFSRDILFASLLPALLFLVSITSAVVCILGIDNVMTMYADYSVNAIVLMTFMSVFILIVISYVLYSIRDMILAFWCGSSFWHRWCLIGLKTWHKRRYDRLFRESNLIGDWMNDYSDFDTELSTLEKTGAENNPIPEQYKKNLISRIEHLKMPPPEGERRALLAEIVGACRQYSDISMVNVLRVLEKWDEDYRSKDATQAAAFDKQYGSASTIKTTELGNVIQAYDEYAYKRYQMEASVFWPRLQKVMDDDYLKRVADQRITVDFAVTCAMLAMTLLIFCILGPLIYSNYVVWSILASICLLLTYASYRMAVNAAFTLGQLVRSAYDLYRLKLLKALHVEWPANTTAEKASWLAISQAVSYGQSPEFILINRKQ